MKANGRAFVLLAIFCLPLTVLASEGSGIRLELIPWQPLFEPNRTSPVSVSFTARIHNLGDKNIEIAHPHTCIEELSPDRIVRGDAEIRLDIKKPDGRKLVLREAESFFQYWKPYEGSSRPDSAPFLTVQAQGSAMFTLSWFFRHARVGGWEPREAAENAFDLPGVYKVRVTLRNTCDQARWNGEHGVVSRSGMWTGEASSPEISFEVRNSRFPN